MTELMHLKHFSSKVMPAWSQGWDLVAVAPVQCLSASQGAGPNTKSTQSRAVPNANTTHHRAVLNKKSTDRSVPNATSTYHRAVTSTIHSQGCTKYKIYQLLNFVTTAKITVRVGFAHCSNSREVRFWYFPSALSLEDDIRQRQWLGEEKIYWEMGILLSLLLAPTGALIVMMVYYISAAATAATFPDFHSVHWCLQVSL